MKLALPLFFLFAVAISIESIAQGSIKPVTSAIKINKQAKPQLRVRSSQQAAQMVKSRFGGKVLRVQKQKSGYRVKLIKTDGHIISVYVDAITGRMSGGH